MKPFFIDVVRALQAAALLCVAAALLPPLFEPAQARSFPNGALDEVAVVGLAFLAATVLVRLTLWLWRGVPKLARGVAGLWLAVHPRRGLVGRWYHQGWCEPLAAREQAREALAQHYGYRLPADGYDVARIRPSIRSGRFGVWVTVQKRTRRARHWQCSYTRWVGDPNELWLLRSSLRPEAEAAPQSVPLAQIPLDGFEGAELDELLSGRPAGSKPGAFLPRPRPVTV